MLAIIIVVMLILLCREAFQHYNAEKYAQKVVYDRNINFFDFMLSEHPFLFIGGVIFLILVFIAICFT